LPRTIHATTQTYRLPGELFTPEERAALSEMTLPPELLHQCRFGRLEYDWRPTAIVGRFVCRDCGVTGQCGACAELAGQRVPAGIVPCLCALHGGLLEIDITAAALAVAMPEALAPSTATLPKRHRPRSAVLANRKEEERNSLAQITQIALLS
jgi:hypothetical protein